MRRARGACVALLLLASLSSAVALVRLINGRMDLPVVDLLNDRAVSDAALWTGDAPIFFGCEAGGAVRIELRGELVRGAWLCELSLARVAFSHARCADVFHQ